MLPDRPRIIAHLGVRNLQNKILSNQSRPSVERYIFCIHSVWETTSGICGVVSHFPTEAEVSRTAFIRQGTERSGLIDLVFWCAPPLRGEDMQGTRHGDGFCLNNRKARNSVVATGLGPSLGT